MIYSSVRHAQQIQPTDTFIFGFQDPYSKKFNFCQLTQSGVSLTLRQQATFLPLSPLGSSLPCLLNVPDTPNMLCLRENPLPLQLSLCSDLDTQPRLTRHMLEDLETCNLKQCPTVTTVTHPMLLAMFLMPLLCSFKFPSNKQEF